MTRTFELFISSLSPIHPHYSSSKVFKPNEPSISYICSRYYRAPELILGSTFYTTSVGLYQTSFFSIIHLLSTTSLIHPSSDLWSLGCVIAEMLLGRTFFAGTSSTDQMTQIIKVLGPPTPVQLTAMTPNMSDLKHFSLTSTAEPRPFYKVFYLPVLL